LLIRTYRVRWKKESKRQMFLTLCFGIAVCSLVAVVTTPPMSGSFRRFTARFAPTTVRCLRLFDKAGAMESGLLEMR
jgi:hypothetical protein